LFFFSDDYFLFLFGFFYPSFSFGYCPYLARSAFTFFNEGGEGRFWQLGTALGWTLGGVWSDGVTKEISP
jgi:hypothetical protein